MCVCVVVAVAVAEVCAVNALPTPHTEQKKDKNEGEQEEVIVSSAYQNLPTKGYHVPQRFTERNHWMTIEHECSHIFLLITTH